METNNRQLIDSSNLRGQTYKILKNMIIPHRGAFVAKQSKENIIEILQLREVLEGLVVRLVTPLLEESAIQELRSCLEKLRAIPEAGGRVSCNVFAVKERFLSLWHRLGDIFNPASENMAYIARVAA